MSNTVQPIRDLETLEKMKQLLLKRDYKYYFLFTLCTNIGLRVGDALRLHVRDVKNQTHINLRQQKTGVELRIKVNQELQEEIRKYTRYMQEDDVLFPNGRGGVISRQWVWQVINDTAKECGIRDHIGTHTMRKTFGYWFYKRYKDVYFLMNYFRHSSQSMTLRYIGVSQDEIDKMMDGFSI